jgi:hypothetical protein
LLQQGVDVRNAGDETEDPVSDAATSAPHRVLVLNTPARPRLEELRDRLGAQCRAVVYVEPPNAAILARAERALLSGRALDGQFRQPRPLGYRAMLERYEQAFGPEHVAFRIAGPAHLPGSAIIDDFWLAAGLPGDPARLDLSAAAPASRLSLEAALVLDRLITHHAKYMDRARHPAVASVALKSVSRLAGRPFSLPRDHVAEVLKQSREDINWLAARVGDAALAEPRPRFHEPAWAMDPATLDSFASFIIRAARQT